MKQLTLTLFLIPYLVTCVFAVDCFAIQGEDGSRNRQPPKKEAVQTTSATTAPGRRARRTSTGSAYRRRRRGMSKGARFPLSTLSLIVNPPDSKVLINGQTLYSRGRTGRLTVNLRPGSYAVTAIRPGYIDYTQSITLSAGSVEPLSIILNPKTSSQMAFTPNSETTLELSSQELYVIVSLSGRSGNTTASIGSLAVIISVGIDTHGGHAVVGMLNGSACQVEFVRIENVAEYSFVEVPGPLNQWAKVVVRIRPQDSKRPIHFSINWKSL